MGVVVGLVAVLLQGAPARAATSNGVYQPCIGYLSWLCITYDAAVMGHQLSQWPYAPLPPIERQPAGSAHTDLDLVVDCDALCQRGSGL